MTTRLFEWLGNVGAQPASDHVMVASPEEWLDRAVHRPEWTLWGKASPQSSCPAHPLLCHMVDVAAVASRLLTTVLPRGLRDRLLAIDEDEVQAFRTLLLVIALHDLGKATPAFQAKVEWARRELPRRGFDLDANRDARHHGDIGLYFLTPALEQRGASADVARALARAVTAHHGQFPTDDEGLRHPGSRERGVGAGWDLARTQIVESLATLFGVSRIPGVAAIDHAYVVLLAGLTAVADWVGSMAEIFTYEPPQGSLATYWPIARTRAERALEIAGMRAPPPGRSRTFAELFPGYLPWPLHCAADAIASELREPALIVIEAPMGEGKTEAALLLSEAAATGQDGLYVGLPTQATANQMFGRVERFLRATRPDARSTLLLAHGEAQLVDRFARLKLSSVYDRGAGGGPGSLARGAVRAEAWFLSRKRALLAQFAVGTIDQALVSVMRVPHAFVRLYGLAGKTVVLDEIHAYDTYTGTLLDRLVEWLAAAGTTVVLLSATLPTSRRADLVRSYRKGARLPDVLTPAVTYPRITVTGARGTSANTFAPRSKPVRIGIERTGDDIEAIASDVVREARHGGCIGWICNTVSRAQAAAVAVRELAPDIGDQLLLHARLLPDDRALREDRLDRWLGPPNRASSRPERCIVIGTQVLEQSLDIDFDLLVTDVAPVDLLLQRAGRLWRHARSNRSPAHPSPRLIVAFPQGAWADAPIDGVASVYAELLVRRTLRLLENRPTLTLPDDISPWVEEVYSVDIPPGADALYGAWIEHHGGNAAKRGIAEQKLMPHSDAVDDPFGALRVTFDDDDPTLHEQLRAVTRLGPPSVDLVCVERKDGRLFVGDGDTVPLDLEAEPNPDLVSRLVRRSIGVSSRRVVPAIQRDLQAAPTGWSKSSLLRYRRVVAFENHTAKVGDAILTLDSDLGLVIESDGGGLLR